MIANVLRYGGYYAEFGYDESADAFHGRVIGIGDVVDFYGRTVEELKEEFRNSVDEYVAWCREEGEAPQKAWTGRMTLRPSDEQHRRYLAAAAARRKSVHAWMLETLDRESASITQAVPAVG
jgi:predicted HicB family RNase H-like nuclease